MLTITDAGINIGEGQDDGGFTVPWDLLNEYGIFRTTTVVHYAHAHPEHLERTVWAVWRAHITGRWGPH